MKKDYNNCIKLLILVIVLCLIFYIITATYNWNIISTILGNMSIGFFTGFIILLITNLKNSLIYKNNIKISELRNMIDNSRNYQIQFLNFKNSKNISIIELLNFYADLSNLFTDIEKYNKEIYVTNKCECKMLVDNCTEKMSELSDIMHEIDVDYKKYSNDLNKNMHVIFNLRRNLQSDLKLLEKETIELYKSIW